MSDRARTKTDLEPLLTVGELMLWVAALAALLGMIGEFGRQANVEATAGFIGVLVVFYILYIAGSVRLFWKGPRVVVPVTILLGSLLWTFAIQTMGRVGIVLAVAIPIVVPIVMVFTIRWLFPQLGIPSEEPENTPVPSLVRSLMDRGKRFSARSPRARTATEPEPEA